MQETQSICYNYWGNGKICDNCISVRAYRENKSFLKLEQNKDAVYLVTALPITNTAHPVVLELLRNATNSMLVGTGDYNNGQFFQQFVQQMTEIITRDSLTNLYNRRFVDERLPSDIVKATLNHVPLSICFIDLDHFKSINDRHGHKVGDLAIKAASAVIARNLSPDSDWAARYGGDEFLLCFNHADEDRATQVAERIEKEMEKFTQEAAGEISGLSISFGIATMHDTPMTAEELIHMADQRMYSAKRMKRQCSRGDTAE